MSDLRDLSALGALPETEFRRIYWTNQSGKIGAAGDIHVVHDLEPFHVSRTAELLTYFGVGEPVRVEVVHRASQNPERKRRGRRPPATDTRTGFAAEVAAPFAGMRTCEFPR